jgi:hypothetical protein
LDIDCIGDQNKNTLIIKYVFSIYHGKELSLALPFEGYPVTERYGYRLWGDKVYPCYDIKNKYMGYMDNGIFYDMREGWYCTKCNYETTSFLHIIVHNTEHFLCVKQRQPSKKYNKYDYLCE